MRLRQINQLKLSFFPFLVFMSISITALWTLGTFYRPDGERQSVGKPSRNAEGGNIRVKRDSLNLSPQFRSPESLSFEDVMKIFPWTLYKQAVHANDSVEIQKYSTLLLRKLVPFLKKPPMISINASCEAPPPPLLAPVCNALQKPRKLGLLWQLGFDVDALEIHLNELDRFVDKFFIIESVEAHSAYLTKITKPLMWDMLKYDDRFAKFSDKIVHFVVDDASLSNVGHKGSIWSREHLQGELRWQKFLEWNHALNYFQKDDLIGFGDVDELAYWGNVNFMKNCKLPSDPVDISIWFPFDGINTILASDFPVKGHAFTFGEPTFWTFGNALQYFERSGKPPTKLSGKSLKYLLGGMHLSRYAFPPFQMTKLLTKSSARLEGTIERIIQVGMLYAGGRSTDAQDLLDYVPSRLSGRIQSLEAFRTRNRTEADQIVKVPWFLECNRQRYPAFNKEPDARLED